MDALEKFLRKLDSRLAQRVIDALAALAKNDLKSLDSKPLTDRANWFRCRIGDARIVFVRTAQNTHVIIEVGFRGGVYKKK